MLLHMNMTYRTCGKLGLRKVIKLFLVFIRVQNCLKSLAVSVCMSGSSFWKFDVTIWARFQLFLVVLLIKLSFSFIEIFLWEVTRAFDFGLSKKSDGRCLSGSENGVIFTLFGVSQSWLALLFFHSQVHCCSHEFYLIFLGLSKWGSRGSHFQLWVVLKKRVSFTDLVFNHFVFFVVLSFWEGPWWTFVSSKGMVRVMAKLSIREDNRPSEIASFLSGNWWKSCCRCFSSFFDRCWRIFDGSLNGFAIVIERLIAKFTRAREIGSGGSL